MEKRILADQGNTLVDLCKVRASERIEVFKHVTNSHRFLPTDAEPDVRHRGGGAGLQGGAGLAHPQPGEAR